MRMVFFGTPEYVIPVLDFLNKQYKEKGKSPIVAVVTQKPKPIGRKKTLSYSPVDIWAHKRNIPIYFDSRDLIKNEVDAQLGILASYGEIIPKDVIDYFKYGILNIHPSLLPKYRGASPVPAAIACGETTTGVSIIKLDDKLDHGDIVCQFKEDIYASDTTQTLRARIFERSAEVVSVLIPSFIKGKIKARKQDEKKATFTRQVTKEDSFIPPDILESILFDKKIKEKEFEIPFIKDCQHPLSSKLLNNFIRAMFPWPICWTKITLNPKGQKKRIKIVSSHLEGNKLILDEVQLEGKNKVTWKQFAQGYPGYSFEA